MTAHRLVEGGAVQRWLVAWGVIGVRVLVQLFVVLIFVSTFGVFSIAGLNLLFIQGYSADVARSMNRVRDLASDADSG